jgi:hypothetical protein
MKVTQSDSRSIRIVSGTGVTLRMPYRFFWNGHERPAESIALTSPDDEDSGASAPAAPRTGKKAPGVSAGPHDVRAFFLFGEIRDRITEDSAGITLSRTWSVKTPGTVHLSIDVEIDPPADLAFLFPGLHSARGLPAADLSFLGEKTAYPSSLFLRLGGKGVLMFSPSATCGGTPGSIGVSRMLVEDEPARLRVELRFPGIEKPGGRIGPKPGDVVPAEDASIESPGSLDRSHDLCFAFAGKEEIVTRGGAAVLQRIAPSGVPASVTRELVDTGSFADALHGVLERHLHEHGGVCGLREIPDSPWISVSAGLGCGLALWRLFPQDAKLGELALRLADFALKGQVPWGCFYESFHVPTGRWRGVRGHGGGAAGASPGSAPGGPVLSVGQSARIAELLLELSSELAEQGLPHDKYFLAGLRFVDFFLEAKGRMSIPGGLHSPASSVVSPDAEPGLAGLEVFFPVARVFARTGHDRYKKALDVLVHRFSSLPWNLFEPPATREGRGSDAAGALLAAQLYVEMRGLGYKPAEPPASGAAAAQARAAESARLFTSLVVPWIRVHDAAPGGSPDLPRSGTLLDSFARQRLLCAGHETALLLMRLEALTPAQEEKLLLLSLARDCLASARCAPIGTAFIHHTLWNEAGAVPGARGKRGVVDASGRSRMGPVDSRRVAREVLAGIRLASELPQ